MIFIVLKYNPKNFILENKKYIEYREDIYLLKGDLELALKEKYAI